MPRPPGHSFRYEHDLCTLPEDVTLRAWRCRDGAPPRAEVVPGRLGRLRRRLRRRRAA